MCRVYLKYKDDLLTLANALLNDHAEAQDIVHDVFVSFATSAGSFRLTGSLKGYLARCVGNLARDRMRSSKRDAAYAEKMSAKEPAPLDANNPAKQLIHAEQLQLLRYALAKLPDEQREAILLHLKGPMTFKKIAEFQNVSINTAQGRYRYGLDKLKSLMNSEVEK